MPRAGLEAEVRVFTVRVFTVRVRGKVRVRVRVNVRVRVKVRVRVRCFVVNGGHERVLCVRQSCGRRS